MSLLHTMHAVSMCYTSSELVVLIDIELPGMITEFHDTGGNG